MLERPNKRWWYGLLWSILAIAMLVAGTAVWLFTADLGVFQRQIEQLISERIGREFAIGGKFDLHLGRTIEIVAEDVSLQNADWAGDDDMVNLGRLEAHIDLRSLINGPIVINEIDVADASIRLTESVDHQSNWKLDFLSDREPGAPESGERNSVDWRVERVNIEKATLTFTTPYRPNAVVVRIDSLRRRHAADNRLHTTLTGAVNDRSILLTSTIGTWQSLLAGRDVSFDIEGQLDDIVVNGTGHIDDFRTPVRPSFEILVSGPDISNLSHMLGHGDAGVGPIDLRVSLTELDDQYLALRMGGVLGQTSVDAVGRLSDLSTLENTHMELNASGPDFGRVLSYFGIDGFPQSAFEVAFTAERTGAMLSVDEAQVVFDETRLDASATLPNFPGFENAKVRAELRGPDFDVVRRLLQIPVDVSGPFSANLEVGNIADDRPRATAELTTTLMTLKAAGAIGAMPDFVGTDLQLELETESLRQIGAAIGNEQLPDQSARAVGSIERLADGFELRDPVSLYTDGLALQLSGKVGPGAGRSGNEIRIEVDSPDLRDTMRRFGATGYAPAIAASIRGDLLIDGNGIEIRDSTADIGKSSFDVSGWLSTESGMVGTRISIAGSGDDLEEILSGMENVSVPRGPYRLSGTIARRSTGISVDGFELVRDRGRLTLDGEVGWPPSDERLKASISASGPDIRSFIDEYYGFRPFELPFSIDATLSRDSDFLAVEQFEASVGTAGLSVHGQLQSDGQDLSGQLRVSGEIPNLSELGLVDGRRMIQQALRWDGRIEGAPGGLTIDEFNAAVGESDISGRVEVRLSDTPYVVASLKSERLSHLSLLEPDVSDPIERPISDGYLIPDFVLPLELLHQGDADLEVRVKELRRESGDIRNLTFRGGIIGGELEVRELSADLRSGHIDAQGSLLPDGETGRVVLAMQGRDLDFTTSRDPSGVPMDAEIDVLAQSTGRTSRELAANLNGIVVFSATGGRIENNRFASALYGNLLDEVLSTINPFFKSEEYTNLNCVVVPIKIDQGMAGSNPNSFIQTDRITIVAKSEVDLLTEELEVHLRTLPRRRFGVSAGELVNPYIKVVGTLASPKLAVDEKGVLITGGAAAATGGLSILAKAAWDRLSGPKNPCQSIAAQARELIDRYAEESDLAN